MFGLVGTPGLATRALHFGVLGVTMVAGEDGEIEIHGAVRRRLLTRLLISPSAPVSVDRLKEDLWEGRPPATADSTLKSHVSLLRRSLGADRLSSRGGSYIINLGRDELDSIAFERESAAGRAEMSAQDFRAAAASLGGALSRWRGPALVEVADTAWGRPEAVRLEEIRAVTTEAWLEARIILGDAGGVVPDAEAAVAEYPLREALWAKLITALFLSGSQADALRAYQRLRAMLGDELGISPSRELVMLEGAILRQDLDIAGVVERSRATATGSMGAPTSAVAVTPSSTTSIPLLLRREQTSFVPRPTELAEIVHLLAEPGLVTLAGTGGTGKTRLAVRAARELLDRFDSVWFCELAPIDDPAEVPRALASALGCADHPGADLSRTIAERADEGRNLLVLDNCEHLVDAASRAVADLLVAAPALRVLATSRSPLGVNGERVHWVPAMSLPPSDCGLPEVIESESVKLFVERAKSRQSGFVLDEGNRSAVTTICIRLDGVPLPLELAAARLGSLSLEDIRNRLDDRFAILTTGPRTSPERQRSLRALIDWSYNLLTEAEREVFRRLAVFASGFDLSGAEAVGSSATIERHDVLDVVASLVDKSLLRVDTTGATARYGMLETIREYAAGKLEADEAEGARSAHAAHFLRLVEMSAPHFSGHDESEWRARLEDDDENLRVAFNYLASSRPGRADSLRFGAAVARYWNSRGIYGDDVDLLVAAIGGDTLPTPERGAALAAAGYMMFRRGDGARAREYLDEAMMIAGATDSEALRADALRTLAWLADRRGDHEAALTLAGDAVDSALRSEDNHLIARAYDVRAAATHHRDPEGARRDYAEALKYCRIAGDGLGQASALNNLAVLDLEQGDHAAARDRLRLALELAATVRDAALVPFLEYALGLVACLEGDHGEAGPAFSRALSAARRTGQRTLVAYAVLGAAAARAITPNRRRDESAVLLGASSALFKELGEQPEALEAALLERTRTLLLEALGDELAQLLDEGARTPIARIVELATAPT